MKRSVKRTANCFPGRRSRGFTLLEVLLAFLVFSLSFATVLQILSGSIRNTVRARHMTDVALLAQSVMDTVGIDIALEEGGGAQGTEGEYAWVVEIYTYSAEESSPNGDGPSMPTEVDGIILLKVDLAVFWGEPPRDRVQYFSTVKAVMAGRL